MTSPTDGRLASCPVCSEALAERPARCFRCETPLERWWAFEESLGALGAGAPRPAPVGPRASFLRTVPAVALGVVLGAFGLLIARRPEARPAAVRPPAPAAASGAAPSEPAPIRPSPRPGSVAYRVQRGDSRWRIAEALTGDGRRWRELWPEHQDDGSRLAAGALLRVDLSRLEGGQTIP